MHNFVINYLKYYYISNMNNKRKSTLPPPPPRVTKQLNKTLEIFKTKQ